MVRRGIPEKRPERQQENPNKKFPEGKKLIRVSNLIEIVNKYGKKIPRDANNLMEQVNALGEKVETARKAGKLEPIRNQTIQNLDRIIQKIQRQEQRIQRLQGIVRTAIRESGSDTKGITEFRKVFQAFENGRRQLQGMRTIAFVVADTLKAHEN